MVRPFIHINCASTMDGKIANPDGSRLRISGPWDIERVHRLRAELGAILVGAGTIVGDDPKLTVKEDIVNDAPPLCKIVLDGVGRIDPSSRFLRTRGKSIILTSEECDGNWYSRMMDTVGSEGLDVEMVKVPGNGARVDLLSALSSLKGLGVENILVEGGSGIIWEFVKNGLFDRFTVYFGPMMVGGSGPALMGGIGCGDLPIDIKVRSVKMTPDGGVLVEFCLKDQ